LSVSVIIDLLIAAILALSIYLGWTKGMVRGLLTLAGTILALIVASQIADVASDLVVERVIRPATLSAIEQHADELNPESFDGIEQIEQVIDAIENDLVREKAKELLSTVNLPTGEFTRDAVLRIGCELVDTVLRGAVRDILSAVIFILCFALISLALRPVIWMVEQAFRLPLLRELNQFGGLLSGAVRGILLVLIGVWVLRLTGMYLTEEVIAESYLLKSAVMLLDTFGLGNTAAL